MPSDMLGKPICKTNAIVLVIPSSEALILRINSFYILKITLLVKRVVNLAFNHNQLMK